MCPFYYKSWLLSGDEIVTKIMYRPIIVENTFASYVVNFLFEFKRLFLTIKEHLNLNMINSSIDKTRYQRFRSLTNSTEILRPKVCLKVFVKIYQSIWLLSWSQTSNY